MSRFEARLVRSSHYRALSLLCRRAVGPGNYVLNYLRDAIMGHTLFLAFHENQLVGMTNFEHCIDGSGWMSMARTDPDWRRQGVALFLQRAIAEQARKHRIRTLRLWTLSTNKPAIKACLSGGFKPVCRMVHVSQVLPPRKTADKPAPTKIVSRQLLDTILHSHYLSKMYGYMADHWQIIKPDRKVLRLVAQKRRFFCVNDACFLLSIPDYANWVDSKRRLHGEFTLLHGPVRQSFRTVKNTAESLGIGFIGGYLPLDDRLLAIGKKEGFRKD